MDFQVTCGGEYSDIATRLIDEQFILRNRAIGLSWNKIPKLAQHDVREPTPRPVRNYMFTLRLLFPKQNE
jgi:hypothetical protein